MTVIICELKASAIGSSSRAALQENACDVEWKATEKMKMPWQPSSWDLESNTLDFCFKPTAELTAWVFDLETDIVQQVANNSEIYFAKPLALDVVKATFQSALKISAKGTEYFKCKGRYSNIKFWDKHLKPTNQPTVWSGDDEFKFVLRAAAIWLNEKSWGISFDLRHLQIFDTDCPF
jgi:hypothetical protein